MATVILKNSDFVNNKFYVEYGTRQQAMFTIIDEAFKGTNDLGVINKVTCMVRQLDTSGNVISSSLSGLIIGIGDGKVGVQSDDPTLRGKVLTHNNMEQCTVTLYEV